MTIKYIQTNKAKNLTNTTLLVWRIHEIVRDHTFKDRPKNN